MVGNRCLLNTSQASFHLGVSPSYLQRLRRGGKGPTFRRHSRFVLYHIDDLDAWSLATSSAFPSGRETVRRQWLVDQQLALEQDGQTRFHADLLATLQRRELLRVAGTLSDELKLPFVEIPAGERIEGRLARNIELASGRHGVIERSRDFTLVPWRSVLEQRIGQNVSGVMREGSINWSFGRERGGPGIS